MCIEEPSAVSTACRFLWFISNWRSMRAEWPAHGVDFGKITSRKETFFGYKAYISAEVADELWQHNRIRLPILPWRNQKRKHPKPVGRFYNSLRQIIETVNSQPAAQFNIETNHAHTLWSLCARLYTKWTAHTLCIYINRLLGVHDSLQIKNLAFPKEHKALVISAQLHFPFSVQYDFLVLALVLHAPLAFRTAHLHLACRSNQLLRQRPHHSLTLLTNLLHDFFKTGFRFTLSPRPQPVVHLAR